MPFATHEMTIDAESPFLGGRIDRCVQSLVGVSRSQITGMFDHECVFVNGVLELSPARRLEPGHRVRVRYELNRRYSPKPHRRKVHRGFSIVHEDTGVIVVEKSAELLTVPTDANEPHTLVDRVNEYVKYEGHGRGAFVVHRLDRGVSGLLVFGKTQELAKHLQRQFAQRKPEREYRALVAGIVAEDEGEFCSRLATSKNLNRYSTKKEGEGELAITHFQVLERLRDVTLLTARLETGRRNQIRVHLAEAGHPVLGDTRYKADIAAHQEWPYRRMALHAAMLAFHHPVTDEPLRFSSEIPREMTKVLNKQRESRQLRERRSERGARAKSSGPPKRERRPRKK